MRIFVALYEHRHGTDIRAFTTRVQAWNWKDEIAEEWWDHEFPDEDRPAEGIGDEYFSMIGARGDGKYFTIEEVELEVGLEVGND